MTAPHIRDLNLNDWHEVPKNATIPAGTRYVCTFRDGSIGTRHGGSMDPAYRNPDARYFTAEPIPDPREVEIEAEAARLYRLVYPESEWECEEVWTHEGFLRLAIDSLDRQAARE